MQLQNDYAQIRKAGLGLAAISYDSTAVLHDFAARKAITFPLLSDHDSATIRVYGVANRRFRRGMELDVETETIYNSPSGNIPVYGVAYPSVFVLDPAGKVEWRFVSEADEFRLTGAAILQRSIGAPLNSSSSPIANGPVQIRTGASNASLALGNRAVISVELKLPPGYHVYAPNPGGEYRGISWEMPPSNCWQTGEPAYPEPLRKTFAFSSETLPVYEGNVQITRELAINPVLSAKDPSVYEAFRAGCLDASGKLAPTGTLKFQACNERQCFPPQSLPLKWKFQFIPPDRQRVPLEHRREFDQ